MRYVLVALVVLAGCAQSVSPSPGSSAVSGSSPVVSGSPGADLTCAPMGGAPRPCSPEEFRETEEQNRLTEEAIGLYRRWIKESTRLYRAGGTDKPTKEMLATTAGDFQGSVLGIFQDLKAVGVRAVSGEVKIVTIGPDLDARAASGTVAMFACLDSRSLKFQRKGRDIRRGTMFVEYFVARPVDGGLRLWSVSSGEVTACAAQ